MPNIDDIVKPTEVERDERDGDKRFLRKIVSEKVRTLADLARVCDIDTAEWEIYKWRCGAWQTGMKLGPKGDEEIGYSQQFTIMAWMRLRKAFIAARDELESLRKKAIKHRPGYRLPKIRKANSGTMCEYSIVDHHLGALIWGKETGGEDWDSRKSRSCFEDGLSALIERTKSYKPDIALLVLGNDQQNIDNRHGATESGTPQDSDSRYQKIFGISRDLSIWAIEALASIAPRVDVMMVPGNHDQLATWHLGDSLQSWFRSLKNINIDNSPRFRKFREFGCNMLMFTHGNKGKLERYGQIMAAEEPEMWGRTKWREAHTAHRHHRRVIEDGGATVRILPSLRPPDAWSSENHFVGAIRAGEAFAWSASSGLIGTAFYSVLKG